MVQFFDCNCATGRQGVRRNQAAVTADELLEEMRYAGIAEALVYHVLAKEYDPAYGNRRLLEEVQGHPPLHPCWVVMPHHTGEMARPEELVEQMAASGVRAARAFPISQNFRLGELSAGALLAALQDRRIPLFVEKGETDWREIEEILTGYPQLPLVLCNVNYRTNRLLYPFLERFENFHVEICLYEVHRGLEHVCRTFGSSRLLFGTYLPFYSPGSALMMVKYARIGEADRQAIAGGNLRRLLEGVKVK